tara:strand:+ start:602 stop:1300 length:699 start_codon:yes stop_codon:yes gene_type:complete
LKIKNLIKNNLFLYNFLINFRDKLRIIYNQKRRSRFFWDLRRGDSILSLDYPLSKDSLFFDIGAHVGNFSIQMAEKYDCNIYAFEPLEENYNILKEQVKRFQKVKCFEVALSNYDGESYISNLGASASLFNRDEGDLDKKISVKSFSTFVKEKEIAFIDLVKMNIEGSEYDLLDEIIDSEYIKNINHLQIQFHNFVNDSKEKRKKIRKKLKLTHINKYNFPFIWERWDLKKN